MENILRAIYQERASHPDTLGVLLLEKQNHYSNITDSFDEILLIITEDLSKNLFMKHYGYGDMKFALYMVNDKQLREWLSYGSNNKVFDWILFGKVLFDRNDYLQQLIQDIRDFPFQERKQRIGLEFAKLIRQYLDGKTLYEQHQYLDAYSHIVYSLHHLGRLAVIEKGYHPEVTVWNQVKQIEPEVFKMYEELVNSEEPIKKRLELLFLVSEFFIHSKIDLGSTHLLEILSEREKWSIQEMLEHPKLKLYTPNLVVFLEYLVDRNFIGVELVESKGKGIYHRYYKKI